MTPLRRRSTAGSLTDFLMTGDQTFDTPQKSNEKESSIPKLQNESTQKAKKTSTRKTPKMITKKTKLIASGTIKKTKKAIKANKSRLSEQRQK